MSQNIEGDLSGRIANTTNYTRVRLRKRVEGRAARHKDKERSTSKTRKSAATRKRIMDAAAQIMVERGNSAFQMSEISQRCSMSKGALYYYFADKEDLVRAVYDNEIDDLIRAIDTAVENTPTSVEALRGACNEFAIRVGSGSPLAMALVRELILAREGTSDGQQSRMHHIVNVVATQLERARAEGVLRSDLDLTLAAVSVCGAFTFAAASVVNGSGSRPGASADFASELFDIIVRGLGAEK